MDGSWSDGTTIPQSASCLLDGFDPARMLLLLSCGSQISGRLAPNQGARVYRCEPRDRLRLKRAANARAPAFCFLLLSQGLGGNTLKADFNTAMEA